MPRLEACYFLSPGPDDAFRQMARVLEMTAAQHCAGWQRTITMIAPGQRSSAVGLRIHEQNVQKVEYWTQIIETARDGECVLLLDADTAIVRSLDDVWSQPFDLAYTIKRRPFPFNLGVLFVRVSDRTRTFFRRWRDDNLLLLGQTHGVSEWRQRYGGINQASFGRLLDAGALSELALSTLPCSEWNCEESAWVSFNPVRTRILHVKGALRKSVFLREPYTPDLSAALEYYRGLLPRSALVTASV